jgi:hypothetical protein
MSKMTTEAAEGGGGRAGDSQAGQQVLIQIRRRHKRGTSSRPHWWRRGWRGRRAGEGGRITPGKAPRM